MTVKDYATDVELSVDLILQKCISLNIDATNENDVLTDEDIIMLDNTINLSVNIEEEIEEEAELIEEKFEEDVSVKKMKKQPLSRKENTKFKEKRKDLYKNKEKLQRNKIDETSLIYKEDITLYEIGEQMRVNPAELIKKLLTLDIEINIKDPVPYDVAELLTSEYGIVLKTEESNDVSNFEKYIIHDKNTDLIKRAPIITIMGHVDHGKTSLLDYIRKSELTDAEAGGITQRIGAYQIKRDNDYITFIDTPGHAAFTEMRARGASVTDIIIVIVAADDGVMPQTKEAIEHALAADVPIIVAINKIDKTKENIEKIKTDLVEAKLTPEDWGGDVPVVLVSAYTGEGIDLLLETISTIAEMNEYKANPKRYAIGTVIESKLDKRVGNVSALLIETGTLRVGDPVVIGTHFAKIRSMKNDKGESILEATPSMPVEITGAQGTPEAGDKFMAFETEAEAKKIAEERKRCKEDEANCKVSINLEDLFSSIQGGKKEINILLKADVRGCEEAIKSSLNDINIDGVTVNIVRSGVGPVSESDIDLALASESIVIAFNVPISEQVKNKASIHNIEIRDYNVIYKLIEDVELAMTGMLDPVFEEKELGKVEVRKIFSFSKVGNIAGSYVLDGIVKTGSSVRVIRNNKEITETKILTLQRETDQVREVKKGFECGITLEKFDDIKEGDILECFEVVEVK